MDECTCEYTEGDEHPCPFQEDVNGDDCDWCDCCPFCEQECANDI